MGEIRIRPDRIVDSTGNNEFADGTRDETTIADDMVEIIPTDEHIPEALDEAEVGKRPLYNESGLREDM